MRTPEHNPPTASSPPPDDSDAPAASPRPSPVRPPSVSAGRPRVVEADLTRDRGWGAVVRVVLERGGVRVRTEREAVGEEAVVLRCVAETTLEALEQLLAGGPHFALVGAKRLLAFDSAILLVCVRTVEDPPRRLIGCVPIEGGAAEAVVDALLHATNRVVETIPNASPDEVPSPDADASGDEDASPDPDASPDEGGARPHDVANEDPNQD